MRSFAALGVGRGEGDGRRCGGRGRVGGGGNLHESMSKMGAGVWGEGREQWEDKGNFSWLILEGGLVGENGQGVGAKERVDGGRECRVGLCCANGGEEDGDLLSQAGQERRAEGTEAGGGGRLRPAIVRGGWGGRRWRWWWGRERGEDVLVCTRGGLTVGLVVVAPAATAPYEGGARGRAGGTTAGPAADKVEVVTLEVRDTVGAVEVIQRVR